MKKFLFVGLILFSINCFPQTEDEDAILERVLDEWFETDVSWVDPSPSHYIYASLSMDESVFFAGRDFDINQFGFTPSISYIRGKSFFVSLGTAYFSQLDPKWDFVSVSSGYSLFLDPKERLSITGIYSRIFFLADAEELNPNRFSGALAYRKNKWGMQLSAGYLFGGSPSFYTTASSSYQIPVIDQDKWKVSWNPQLSFLMSQQTVSEQINSGFFNSQLIDRDVFDLINTQISFPIQLDIGNWDFELSYHLNLPKALPSEIDIDTSGYISLSIGFFSSL